MIRDLLIPLISLTQRRIAVSALIKEIVAYDRFMCSWVAGATAGTRTLSCRGCVDEYVLLNQRFPTIGGLI